MTYTFIVPGAPVPKARPRFSRNGHTYTDKKTLDYERTVRLAYTVAKHDKLTGAIKATMLFYLPIAASDSKAKKFAKLRGEIRPTGHVGDTDNYQKSILDSINGVAYEDDCQVVEIHAEKWFSDNPRAVITLEEV